MGTSAEMAAQSRAPDADVLIGRRLRALRLERAMSLTDLASRAGISVSALSQIERGISSLKIKVMWPLAAALNVEPGALLGENGQKHSDLYCVSSKARKRLPVHSDGIEKWLLSPPGAALTGILVSVVPGGTTAGSYTHAGHEFGYVLSGQLELTIDGVSYQCGPGDSFAFRSTLDHAFSNPGQEPAQILWVNTTKPGESRDG
ncbi:MAG: XRE family transcriptional regulator [Acetobacter papayae]|uniref:helix-turn-helix domain-containing protein n=1 Tax=Acetobacter papayae TaxID=1076592 RepID=UPI0039E81521